MKTCPTDKPLKSLRLYWPVRVIVSIPCMSQQPKIIILPCIHSTCVFELYLCDAELQIDDIRKQVKTNSLPRPSRRPAHLEAA